ncbi:uncharacterized protein BO97DRAFT_108742 [Aspergillus homomorphus CBS 101889]|uniref:Uncharacterized protein n=1 Tax=Aspergillus homomorphus (strain CBS 101889) TaxID=1450537 RepID=A0A395HT10_ASPHC|nr:hypothetical protein BO97DRAFT_108742 [Aspergillus homomorphus CBS 101889]RAL10967.1 hypothetical protein BO97DRAFT_108742 [Aspergillus homomorphus CBS 101889]
MANTPQDSEIMPSLSVQTRWAQFGLSRSSIQQYSGMEGKYSAAIIPYPRSCVLSGGRCGSSCSSNQEAPISPQGGSQVPQANIIQSTPSTVQTTPQVTGKGKRINIKSMNKQMPQIESRKIPTTNQPPIHLFGESIINQKHNKKVAGSKSSRFRMVGRLYGPRCS